MRAKELGRITHWLLGCAAVDGRFRLSAESMLSHSIPDHLVADFDFLLRAGCEEKALRATLALATKLPALVPRLSASLLRRIADDLETVGNRIQAFLPPNCCSAPELLNPSLSETIAAYRRLAAYADFPRRDRLKLIARVIPAAYVASATGRPHFARVGRLLEMVGIDVGENYARDLRVAKNSTPTPSVF